MMIDITGYYYTRAADYVQNESKILVNFIKKSLPFFRRLGCLPSFGPNNNFTSVDG